ncbi:MAG: T9SS type A sorting domain-containing protein [Ignavibacteria bacterium]|nr:T9SS type A sorting domain-containing protein [Ignavibacteria bacterium]
MKQFLLTISLVIFLSALILPQAVVFSDDFESYIAGQQVACQNPIDWTTWTLAPCGPEDAVVSTNFAFSGTKSFVIVPLNDFVKPLNDLTSGKWEMRFQMYIPTGKGGYFNTLADFAGGASVWASQSYFDVGGTGRLDAGGASAATFTYPNDTWFQVSTIADLNSDLAELWINGVQVYTWQYTLGPFGAGCPLKLDGNDFYGPLQTTADEAYFDDYELIDMIIPVELTSFTANVTNDGNVVLNWSTATETNNHMFEIERRDENGVYFTIGFVNGAGTTTEPQNYNYTDQTVENGVYFYRLKQIDFNGTYEYFGEIEVNVSGPLTFNLEQNYPNPFNPSTNIKYSVPETGNIRLSVFNTVGEEVAVLVDGLSQSGIFEVSFNASNLPSGVYLYKLQSANSIQTMKMMLLK